MSTEGQIYVDHCATTPPLPAVVETMAEVLRHDWGNPSSTNHLIGRRARARVDTARAAVAGLFAARPDEITFTSGATEACNLAILGVAQRLLRRRRRLVTVATEHPAVLGPARAWEAAGGETVILPVDGEGRLDSDRLAEVLRTPTALVAVMLVNNQTGVVQDLTTICERAHRQGALVFSDCTQAPGRMALDASRLGLDLAACSAHKLGGPAGVGALFKRRGLGLEPLIHGGGQEQGLRPGTEAVAAIAGFGVAAVHLAASADRHRTHLAACTAAFEAALKQRLATVRCHGAGTQRAPGISIVTLPGLVGSWLRRVPEIAASAGSACATGLRTPSPVLTAMGVTDRDAANAVRIGFGRDNTVAEAERVAGLLAEAVS